MVMVIRAYIRGFQNGKASALAVLNQLPASPTAHLPGGGLGMKQVN